MSNNAIRHKNTSGPAEPISSKVSRSQNLTVLSAEPVQGIKKIYIYIYIPKKNHSKVMCGFQGLYISTFRFKRVMHANVKNY